MRMTQKHIKNKNDLNDLKDLQEEIQEEDNEKIEEDTKKNQKKSDNDEITKLKNENSKLKEQLLKIQADYQNFKMRSERDKADMIFFLKNDIFKKILPRVDDIERIIKNTPESERNWTLYEALLVLEKSFKKDLNSLWLESFESIWCEVDPDKHEVMTQIPSETPWVIVDEFEKWYMLDGRVLRVAKVVVWS